MHTVDYFLYVNWDNLFVLCPATKNQNAVETAHFSKFDLPLASFSPLRSEKSARWSCGTGQNFGNCSFRLEQNSEPNDFIEQLYINTFTYLSEKSTFWSRLIV